MDLWIRSQKNDDLRQGLFKVKEIELGDYEERYDCIVVNNLYCVGKYKTKERALEVLDEISEWLDEMRYLEICMKNNQIHKSKPCVYKMPID